MDITRIVAHADFDGLISALFLQEVLGVEEVVFTEPWLIADGSFQVHKVDAVADLPYPPNGCGAWFDHHSSNARVLAPNMHFDPLRKSCPGVIYDLYLEQLQSFHHLLAAAEKIDSADYTSEDLRNPTAAMQISLSLVLGNDRYRSFLLEQLRSHTLEEVASLHPVQERYKQVIAAQEHALDQLGEKIEKHGKVIVVDMTQLPYSPLLPFIIGAQHDVPLLIFLFDAGDRLRLSVGENIFQRTNTIDLGAFMAQYGGGGHKAAAGCSIPKANREELLAKILVTLNQ